MADFAGLIEMLLVFGLLLGWAVLELRRTRRAIREDQDKAGSARQEPDEPR